jgi:hypothetical protein
MIRAYHYTSQDLPIGSKILSNQQDSRTYSLVHKIYREVNPSLPETYGYAYPVQKETSHKHCYLVEVEESQVIKGDYRHSLYVSMESQCRTDNSLPLKERLAKRDENLRNEALKYFDPQNEETVELISDSFVIVEKLR